MELWSGTRQAIAHILHACYEYDIQVFMRVVSGCDQWFEHLPLDLQTQVFAFDASFYVPQCCTVYPFLAGSESDSGWISVNDVELKDVERKDNEMSEHLRQTAEGSRNKRKAKIIRKRRREEERREAIANGKPGEIDNQIKRQRMERAVAISQTRVCF